MPTLDDIARSQTALSDSDVVWLQGLVADWQIIADLAFSDLVLWLPDAEAKGLWASAQIRPATGPTTLLEDVVGTFVPVPGPGEVLQRVLESGVVIDDPRDDLALRLAPVRRDRRVIAVLALRADTRALRAPSTLESTYRATAERLVEMIGRGEFPTPGLRSDVADSLRVGDGFVRTDAVGVVSYASPNALSAYRRLGLTGELVGGSFSAVTATLADRRERGAEGQLTGLSLGETEVEHDGTTVLLRTIPLRSGGRPDGAVVLMRDVTELRVRERELLSKDATIREIHHRVKNNLQTVAALLRLQGRRLESPEARAALDEAVQRVGSIALVHETLSQSFDESVPFDDVADRLLRTVLDVSGPGVRGTRVGTFGMVPGEIATPLAMVLTELIQNAAEHAYGPEGGRLTLAVNRIRDRLRLRVSDEGVGMPSDVTPSLGLSIVTTLVESELNGTLAFERGARGGTTVAITLDV